MPFGLLTPITYSPSFLRKARIDKGLRTIRNPFLFFIAKTSGLQEQHFIDAGHPQCLARQRGRAIS